MTKPSDIAAVLRILKAEQRNTMLGEFAKKKYSPYRILIGTILSARAKDEVTEPVANELFKRYPTAHQLAKANPKDVQKIIKRIGFYRQKTKSIISTAKDICTTFNDRVPKTREELMQLRGVGRKVANCVLVYGFGTPAIPVDVHVAVISRRLGLAPSDANEEEVERHLRKVLPKETWLQVNEWFVRFGKEVCRTAAPRCEECSFTAFCRYYGAKRRDGGRRWATSEMQRGRTRGSRPR